MNKIFLNGNLCRDIEVNHYNDRKVVRNAIAVRRDFKNKDGEYDTDFFDISIWGVQAEFIEKYAHKGDKISIVGKILNNNYEDEQGMHYKNVIQIENIELLTSKSSNDSVTAEKIEDIENAAKEIFGDDVIVEEQQNLLD